MAHGGGLLGFGTDHEARRVAQRQQRQPVRVAQLHEARGLVGGGRVDGAAQVARVVGDAAEGAPFDADQRGQDAAAEGGAQFEHRAGVGQRLDHGAHVVAAQPVLRDHMAQPARVAGLPMRGVALK